jgi:hypothetical protein
VKLATLRKTNIPFSLSFVENITCSLLYVGATPYSMSAKWGRGYSFGGGTRRVKGDGEVGGANDGSTSYTCMKTE